MFDDPNVVLHCEKIDKIYPGTKALDGVSFDVLKGKVNVLIGENGAGKSTLMKMIAGIEQPSNGKRSPEIWGRHYPSGIKPVSQYEYLSEYFYRTGTEEKRTA